MTKKNEKPAEVSPGADEWIDPLDADAEEQERKAVEWKLHQDSMSGLPDEATKGPRPIWDTSHVELKVPADERKPIEFWAEHLATPKWLFAGLKLGKGWAIGQEVTRKTYEEAAEWAANVDCH